MSLDELRDDLKRNMAEARGLTTVDQIRDHIVNTVWPFVEAVVEDVAESEAEQDDAIRELVDHEEDYLQPETAAIFAAVVQSSMQLAAELRKRAGGDAMVMQLITNHEQLCEQAVTVLGEITMIPTDEDEEEGEHETQADAVETGADRE